MSTRALADEQLDALAERLRSAAKEAAVPWRAVAREAARWAAEQQGEVQWQYLSVVEGRWANCSRGEAVRKELHKYQVRAIRVIATTTKEVE